MEHVNNLVETESYRQSLGYDKPMTSKTSTSKSETLKQKRRLKLVWTRLVETYGNGVVNQWGEEMPETWVLLLKEFSSTDLQRGWEGVISSESKYPPTAKEFRDMCLKSSQSHAKNHAAYIDFNDPDHPNYEAPRIESDEMKANRESTARSELDKMKGMF